jgi:tetratricopeptide (TPR) repeat protein
MSLSRRPSTIGEARPAVAVRTLVSAAALLCGLLSASQAWSATADEQYRQALYQRETGQPYSAIETLESLLSANPTLNRARLELAVTYYRTLNYAKARAEAQRVLADPKTPEAVRLSVQAFIKRLDSEEATATGQAAKLEPSVSFGLLFDSNVNAGPDNAVLPGNFTLNPGSLSHSDWGYLAQAALSYTWQRPAPFKLGESTGRVGWTSQASVYYKGYHQYDEYNLGVLSVSTGPTVVVGNNWRGNLNFQLDQLLLGNRDLAVYASLSPSVSWRLGTQGELTADAQWAYRNYQRPTDQGRDAHYTSLGLSYGHLLMQGKLTLQGGVRLFEETALESRFSNDGSEVFAGGRYRAWEGGDLFGRAAWRYSHFKGIEPVYAESRRETEQRIELGASHQFQKGWFEKWQLAATVSHVHNQANLSLYGYDRDMVFFTLARSF